MSRVIRSACNAINFRKRVRALASSRAGPCSVSTKARREASGVRSSWLALAMKSGAHLPEPILLGQIAKGDEYLRCVWPSRPCQPRYGRRHAPLHRHPLDELDVDALLVGSERPVDGDEQIGAARHLAHRQAVADLRKHLGG